MIIDTLDNLKKYESLNPLFPKVVEFLNTHDLATMESGKHEIEGKDLFVNIQMAKGKTPDEAVIETHDKMIDIQIPLTAAETLGYTHREEQPATEYKPQQENTTLLKLAAGREETVLPG